MSYQVLARKWRPRSFAELVGQEHVVRALSNALDHDRLHHAYLFTGTRGVGKTTVARILAKSLNCEQGVSSTPCGTCSACREIDEGRFADLLEVDAASRTKVDQTRELLDNVPYAPVRGRFKIYLIDEVHMFSASSFNALLKTLEEPPPHVKFLLATTDPQKVPVTVLSRCLQFNLKRLPLPQIEGHLRYLLEQEGIGFEAGALRPLARAADGSMRDALSLMDQAIAFGGGRINEADVGAMLGSVNQSQVHALVGALGQGDGAAVLQCVERMAEHTPDFANALQGMLTLLHQIAVIQAVPDALGDEVDHLEEIRALAQSLSPEDVQLFYQIGLVGQRDLPFAPDPRSGFEMIALRMLAFRPVESVQPVTVPSSPKPVQQRGGPARPTPSADTARGASPRKVEAASPAPASAPAQVVVAPKGSGDWTGLIERMRLGGMTRQLAAHCVLLASDGGKVRLMLDPAYKQLKTGIAEKRLLQSLQKVLGEGASLAIDVGQTQAETPARAEQRGREERQQAALKSMQDDPLVHALEDKFGGTLVIDSVEPGKGD